jgi:hypothetical protein
VTKRRAEIERPDTRIAARIETLAFLFDVSVQTIANAVEAGRLKPSKEVFGVKLYHVKSVERAVFGAATESDGAGPEDDPYLKGIHVAAAGKQRALAS